MSALMTVGELARVLIASAMPADVIGDGRAGFTGVSTDSRSLKEGALFVALRGERFDGHDYVARAIESGAAAALVERRVDVDAPQLIVADSKRGFGVAAGVWRSRFALPVIAVAGSNGKTTVTQMIAAILAAAYGEKNRLATLGNLNNDIGVPLMLWQLSKQHRAAVLELGMNHPGEIAYLAQLVHPTVALVNNAQREHQEFMQSVEATAFENGEILAALSDDGVAVFPADDPCASIWRQLAGTRRMIDFALKAYAVVTATFQADNDGVRISMATPYGVIDVRLAAGGEHNVRNALAAAACAIAADIGAEAIGTGLNAWRPVAGRGVKLHVNGYDVIDDTYNANPDSVRAAIDLLAGAATPRVLVLGDMGEVGARGPEFHREVGQYAGERGIETLFAIGPLSRETTQAFGADGAHFDDIDALIAALRSHVRPAMTVLIKGSRFMRMERVVQALGAQKMEPVH
ncbi:MAG TPA: UDP-N-acetylmuramoyl-tripeptide--D-alanyl-D-alanine ligase [Burkholderiaceae bacterium]|nr:UDP-N-acetylmuramoyl-tripeptide--D-alanyl-D-alanine ligase [Burkholderiaceae bacterium]